MNLKEKEIVDIVIKMIILKKNYPDRKKHHNRNNDAHEIVNIFDGYNSAKMILRKSFVMSG